MLSYEFPITLVEIRRAKAYARGFLTKTGSHRALTAATIDEALKVTDTQRGVIQCPFHFVRRCRWTIFVAGDGVTSLADVAMSEKASVVAVPEQELWEWGKEETEASGAMVGFATSLPEAIWLVHQIGLDLSMSLTIPLAWADDHHFFVTCSEV